MPERIRVAVGNEHTSAVVYPEAGQKPGATLILGHGAGSDQNSAFMVTFATGLSTRGINTVTFNFLYTEQHRCVPDANAKLEACWRAVIDHVRREKIGANTLAIGGKSMGGRIALQVTAAGAKVAGLVFLGYPLHPPGKPEQLRSKHLPAVRAPMLFLQGSRDPFGTPDELRPIIKQLNAPVELYVVEDGDHSFKVRKKVTGLAQNDVYTAMLDKIATWLDVIASEAKQSREHGNLPGLRRRPAGSAQ